MSADSQHVRAESAGELGLLGGAVQEDLEGGVAFLPVGGQQHADHFTLLGAAALAFLAVGEDTDLHTRILDTAREIEPHPARAAHYAELYERWRHLRDAIDDALDPAPNPR